MKKVAVARWPGLGKNRDRGAVLWAIMSRFGCVLSMEEKNVMSYVMGKGMLGIGVKREGLKM